MHGGLISTQKRVLSRPKSPVAWSVHISVDKCIVIVILSWQRDCPRMHVLPT